MSDFKNNPQNSGFQFSNLTEDDLKTITDAEQKLSRQRSANQVLIAYDQTNGAK